MKKLFLSILIVFFTGSLFGCNNQARTQEQSVSDKQLKIDKDQFELQDTCGKISKECFVKNYNDGVVKTPNGKEIYFSYRNHYNRKLNKCFMEIIEDGVIGREKELLDVQENNTYGMIRINKKQENVSCYVLDKRCKFEDEWDSLVKPYMEE